MFFDGKQRNSQTLFSSFLFFIRYSIHIRYRYSMPILKQSFVALRMQEICRDTYFNPRNIVYKSAKDV